MGQQLTSGPKCLFAVVVREYSSERVCIQLNLGELANGRFGGPHNTFFFSN